MKSKGNARKSKSIVKKQQPFHSSHLSRSTTPKKKPIYTEYQAQQEFELKRDDIIHYLKKIQLSVRRKKQLNAVLKEEREQLEEQRSNEEDARKALIKSEINQGMNLGERNKKLKKKISEIREALEKLKKESKNQGLINNMMEIIDF